MPKKTGRFGKKGRTARAQQATSKRRAANPFLTLLDSVKVEIDARLESVFRASREQLQPHGAAVMSVLTELADLCLRGGKRLRPALLAAGQQACEPRAKPGAAAFDCGVCLELLQAYFLIHDDWMDGDNWRRGAPSVHAALSRRFRSEHVGASAAVLAGDLAAAMATDILSRLDVPSDRMAPLLNCYAQLQTDAVIGQQLDVLGAASDIEELYRLKTASYTVKGPLVLGALIAGAPPQLIGELEQLAVPAGIAFQLRDDWLGLFGDTGRTGKPFASDIKSGKRTALVDVALRRGNPTERACLRRALGNPRAGQRQLKQAVEAIRSSGAKSVVEQRVDELVQGALGRLESSRFSGSGRALLRGAVQALTERVA